MFDDGRLDFGFLLQPSAEEDATSHATDSNDAAVAAIVVPPGTVIESTGSTVLTRVGNNYFLHPVGDSNGVELSAFGVAVTAGSSGGWDPVAAEAVSGGYEVMWQYGSDQYTLWRGIDSTGNFTGSGISAGLGSYTLAAAESTFGQDFNHDNVIGVTVIEAAGSTSLAVYSGNYYLLQADSQSGLQLTYGGAAVTMGMFGALRPIGAEQTASGYQVVWKADGADQYSIWNTDSSGNYLSTLGSGIAGSSALLLTLESAFNQDLNSSGAIAAQVAVEAAGATDLVKFDGTYFLRPEGGSLGPQLRYNGVAVTDGGGWSLIGAEADSSGYRVALKNAVTGQFKLWNVDGSGNYLSGDSVLSGASSTLQGAEIPFQQDLNADGITGITPTVIESIGSGSLIQIDDTYHLRKSTSDIVLKYAGVPVTVGQFPGWEAIGAEPMGNTTSFRVAWKHVGTDEYKIWETDTNGNYVTGDVVLVGATYAFQVKESGLGGQDINGDGVIGVKTTVIENAGSSALSVHADTYGVGGVLLKYNGTPVTVGSIAGWTPIGGESGTVVWKSNSADQYRVWEIFSDGRFWKEVTVSSAGYALQSLETAFAQDLNGDGQVGAVTTVIDSAGLMKLSRIADAYVITSASGGQDVLFKDTAQVVAGQTGGWTPVGVEWTPRGFYEVVWKLSGVDQFKMWDVNFDGIYSAGDGGTMSGSDPNIATREYGYGQDLNGDGQSLPVSQIEAPGSNELLKIGDYYRLGSLGPLLTNAGSVVTQSQLGDWAPIGAERNQLGEYHVVLKDTNSGQFKIWLTNSSGNVRHDYGVMSGSDVLLRTAETTMQQELNSDGMIGLPDSPFDITLSYTGDTAYRLYVEAAAKRWEQVITADLPSANNATYGTIDDVRINVAVSGVDGSGGALAGGQPVFLRNGSNLTTVGSVTIDSADVASMAANGTIMNAVMHEMGHVLGIGSLWSLFGLASNGQYTGQYGLEAYRELSGDASATFVPLETSGGSGTANKHWSEALFGNELMTPVATGSSLPLSKLTIAALRDLGYSVDYGQADSYTMPGHLMAGLTQEDDPLV